MKSNTYVRFEGVSRRKKSLIINNLHKGLEVVLGRGPALTGTGPTGYTLQAAPQGDQANDKCGTLSLVNAAGAISKTPTNCW